MAPKLKVNAIKKKLPRWEDSYDAVASVGEGAFGSVLHVRSKKSDVEGALKRVSRWTGCGDHEIAVMQHIGSHPNVVRLLDFLTATDCTCMVLELCGGGDLEGFFQHFEPNGFCCGDVTAVQFMMAGVTLALEHLQGKGVIHCDLKPGNILLTEMLLPKLADFGSAKRADELREATCTPSYAAPELLDFRGNRNVPHSFPVDWWSAGVILVELLSGKSPLFHADDHFGQLSEKQIAEIKRQVEKGIPAGMLVEGFGSDLAHGLCDLDSSSRFGPKAVQEHRFFDTFDWPGFKDGMVAPFLEAWKSGPRQVVREESVTTTFCESDESSGSETPKGTLNALRPSVGTWLMPLIGEKVAQPKFARGAPQDALHTAGNAITALKSDAAGKEVEQEAGAQSTEDALIAHAAEVQALFASNRDGDGNVRFNELADYLRPGSTFEHSTRGVVASAPAFNMLPSVGTWIKASPPAEKQSTIKYDLNKNGTLDFQAQAKSKPTPGEADEVPVESVWWWWPHLFACCGPRCK